MRNVKVVVNADTSQAVGKVRELTGALAQLDAATKRNIQSLLSALGGAGLNPAVIGAAAAQQNNSANAQAQLKAGGGAAAGSGGSGGANTQQQQKKNGDTMEKLNKYTLDMAEKQFNLFSEDLAKAFSTAFASLFDNGLKGALTSLRDSLKGLFNGLLKQLIDDIAGRIKKSIASNLKSIFSKEGGGVTAGLSSKTVADSMTPTPGSVASQNPVANPFLPGGGASGGSSWQSEMMMKSRGMANQVNQANQANQVNNATTIDTVNKAPAAANVVTTAANKVDVKAPGGFSWNNLGKMIGSMAPALGSSLGGMLGGTSMAGSLLGSIGGLAGGTALGIATGAISAGANPGFAIFGSVLSAGAATGILAGVAVAFMIGAYILGKQKQRKADEKTRNQAMLDSLGQLDEILRQVSRDEIDGGSAVSQATGIRKQYMEQMSKLKDSKTRNIALKDVSRLDSKITAIRQAADSQSARKALDAKLVPTFADGGFVGGSSAGYKVLGSDGGAMSPFRGRVPGVYDRRDDFLARLTGNEVVLTPDVWMPIAPYLKKKRVPGFADGGFTGSVNTLGSGNAGSNYNQSNQQIVIEELIINLSNQFGAESAAKIMDVAVKTPEGAQAIVRSVRTHIGENGLGDGLVRDINKVNERGF